MSDPAGTIQTVVPIPEVSIRLNDFLVVNGLQASCFLSQVPPSLLDRPVKSPFHCIRGIYSETTYVCRGWEQGFSHKSPLNKPQSIQNGSSTCAGRMGKQASVSIRNGGFSGM